MPPPRNLIKFTPRSFDADGNETTTKIEPRNSTSKSSGRGGGGGSGNEGMVQAQSTPTKIPKRINSPEMLEYPRDIGRSSGQGHYMIFDILKFNSGKSTTGKNIRSNAKSNALKNKTKIVIKQIALYMPAAVDVAYGLKYNEDTTSVLDEGAAPLIDAALNAGQALLQNTTDMAGVAAQVKKAGVDASGKVEGLAGDVANALRNKVVGAKLSQQNKGKMTINKKELFFEGVKRRTFSYTFSFIPVSQKDSTTIFEIIESFKMAMLPNYTEGQLLAGTESRTLTIPDIFDIKYMHIGQNGQAAENRYLNRVSTCHLTNMSVKYGDERYTTYTPDAHGAPPQKSSITLQFTEIEIVTKEAAKRGF